MKKATIPIKKTYSLCPVCLERIPAKLIQRDGSWYMEKNCHEHGEFSAVVWRGSSPSFTKWGTYRPPAENEADLPHCPADCGICGKHLQSTCCVLIEVTDRCNLRCPVCFAESGDRECRPEKSISALYEDFKFLADGGRRFIQLSGGEPTVRDDLPEMIAAAKEAGASSVQLNSNGLRLGSDPEFTKRLGKSGLDFVFMQFDGLDDRIYTTLRGRELLQEKLAAIQVCGEHGIGVTLVPTVVPGVNEHQIGEIIRFGLKHSPAVRGVHFQPISYFGRYPEPPKDESRITLPEIIAAIEAQTDGLIRQADLLPSACDHPRCGFHGDFVITKDGPVSLSPKDASKNESTCCCTPPAGKSAVSASDLTQCCGNEALRNRNFVARRWKRNLEMENAAAVLPATEDLMDFDSFLARVSANGFTVTGMAFQDAYNLDLERLRRCSLHVYENGRVIPFCAKYLTSI